MIVSSRVNEIRRRMQEDEDKLAALRKSYQMKRYTRNLIAARQSEKAMCTDFSAPNIAALNTSQSCKAKRTTCMYGSSAPVLIICCVDQLATGNSWKASSPLSI